MDCNPDILAHMQYINKATRDAIGELLVEAHDAAVRYRDKQEPHPNGGVNIPRSVAEIRIGHTRKLLEIIAPQLLKAKSPNDPSSATQGGKL